MWPYDELPGPSEMDTLLKEGAPGINKNFVSWFMEKVISNLSSYIATCDLSLLLHVTNAHNKFEMFL
jgi:hypothetical protein